MSSTPISRLRTSHRGFNNSVIASQRVGAKRCPMTGSAKQSKKAAMQEWIASSLALLAMTAVANAAKLPRQAETISAFKELGQFPSANGSR
jgi:hypothetical protein